MRQPQTWTTRYLVHFQNFSCISSCVCFWRIHESVLNRRCAGIGKLDLNTAVLMCDKCALLSADDECAEVPRHH
jgi:hypothetical protein